MTVFWELRKGRWVLSPSSISVLCEDGWWTIFVGDYPLRGRYTSEQGAKLDAWEFAYSKRKALFGRSRIRLSRDPS